MSRRRQRPLAYFLTVQQQNKKNSGDKKVLSFQLLTILLLALANTSTGLRAYSLELNSLIL